MTAFLQNLRWSPAALRLQSLWKRWRRRRRRPAAGTSTGHCPICEQPATFVDVAGGPRETPMCVSCGSVPRQRALALVLAELVLAGRVPPLTRLAVHESSPSLCTYEFFRRRCADFVASYYWPRTRSGARIGAFRAVDLGAQPFADRRFDLVVTQDVLEHLPAPTAALREIHRSLRPGGLHVFTVPRTLDRATSARAELRDGRLHLLAPAEHHADPVSRAGSLVVTDWGTDLEALVLAATHARCAARAVVAPAAGIAQAIEVFVATTPDAPAPRT